MPNTELEWQTRKERIDAKLTNLNPAWTIVKYSDGLDTATLDGVAVAEYPTDNGPADYALFVKGQFIGIIEAKKVGVSPENVLEQAKRYARGATDGAGQWGEYRVPFLYATNGELIYFVDVRESKLRQRQINNFHTSEALTESFDRNNGLAFQNLKATDINQLTRLRPYQKEAILSIEDALSDGKRAMLVAMATGTGKTYTTVSLIYRLLKSGLFKRVLFLVDRRALAAQAVQAFAAFDTLDGNKFDQEYEVYSQRFQREDFDDDNQFSTKVLPAAYLTQPNATHTFVYVSTIQRMTINLFGFENAFSQNASDPDYEDDADTLNIPNHAFDLIIADECHRGYTAKDTAIWRQTLDHFDAAKIGLTATPAAHTTAAFKEVVYRYGVEQAIKDGFLVDYEAVKISSNIRMNGVFLNEGEEVGVIDTKTGEQIYDELEDEREFSTSEIESKVTAPDSNHKIIEEYAKYALEHEQATGRFPKTLIFAANDLQFTSHSDQLVNICREVFNRGDAFVQKITGNPNVDRPLQKIRQFRNRPEPKIVVTVDMLSTGVDIPSLENIIFLRPVKSRILWEQMLGRGTRLCPEIDKTHFTLFDCFDGTLIEYFKQVSNFVLETPRAEPLSYKQIIENIYQNIDRPYYTKVLVKRLRRMEDNISAEGRRKFTEYTQAQDINSYADDLPDNLKNSFTQSMEILRNPDFQAFLEDYPRAPRGFIVAPGINDDVSSERLVRGEKPEDYLEQFAQFVGENKAEIEALQILFERPRNWNADALKELKTTLEENEYSEPDLQKAFDLTHHKALADIISMVKKSVIDDYALLDAEERVQRTIAAIKAKHEFSPEQLQWLDYIREYLPKNLSIQIDDFSNEIIFERRGGIAKAKMVFGIDFLPELIQEINESIAA